MRLPETAEISELESGPGRGPGFAQKTRKISSFDASRSLCLLFDYSTKAGRILGAKGGR
jgi:hypothetical protein